MWDNEFIGRYLPILHELTDMKHPFHFDPTYGYNRDTLLAIRPPTAPEDMDAFWEQTFQEASQVPPSITQRPLATSHKKYRFTAVQFDSWGGWRIGAWLMVPREGEVRRTAVMGHGYGGRGEPDTALPLAETAVLFPCAPGFNLSARADTPDEALTHVLHGIESRESYILRPCVASLWAAATVLQTLFPQAEALFYLGNSFGGGLGALALPWDKRFERAWLGLPTFGHHPIRLQCPCVGSGEAVRLYAQAHPEVREVLAYYDAAVAAQKINIPVLVSPALFDPAVPPPGQFAVANALPQKELFIREVGHFEEEESLAEARRFYRVLKRWFGS